MFCLGSDRSGAKSPATKCKASCSNKTGTAVYPTRGGESTAKIRGGMSTSNTMGMPREAGGVGGGYMGSVRGGSGSGLGLTRGGSACGVGVSRGGSVSRGGPALPVVSGVTRGAQSAMSSLLLTVPDLMDPTANLEPADVFCALGTLIVEGRLPAKDGSSRRGYYEGPHVELPGRKNRHKCSSEDYLVR